MKRIFFLTVSMLLFLPLNGQTPVGSWSDHLVYNTATDVAVGEKEVYTSTGSSIMVYNKEFSELRKMSRIEGLTEAGINTIAWSEENKTLVIAYTSTNVDLLKNNIIYNIPDIKRKYIPGEKEINRIRIYGKYAYLACSFGIVVIDLNSEEIYDTWKPGTDAGNPVVWDVAFGNGKIYAATGMGVFSGDLSNQGLAYFGNWSLINTLTYPEGKYTSALFSGNKLYVNLTGQDPNDDFVYVTDNSGYSVLADAPGVINKSFDPSDNGFTISSSGSVRYYSSDGKLLKIISAYGDDMGTPDISRAIADNEDIWIADITSGLVRGEEMKVFSSLTLQGPVSNDVFSITSSNGKTIICGGGVTSSWNNLWSPYKVSVFENNNWSSLSAGNTADEPFITADALKALIDPDNSNHLFVSTWGRGLLEYENNILVNKYTEANSPLQTIIAGKPFVRICGLAMDDDKNLWITQTEVPGTIKILKPDGKWIVNPVTIEGLTVGDIIITKTGQKWVILPKGHGLFILDDNHTPEVFTDDLQLQMPVTDNDENVISYVYSIAEDLDGNIWVGTDQGPLVYYNPEKVFDGNLKAYKIKVPRNDGSGLADYMLNTETITSIAVDGANRKWLGTSGSGAYLLSADGTTRLINYNEENSPILSNTIVSLSVDNKTGDVWFGTSKGIQSVRGEAIAGKEEFSDVYTFPNPVREDFTGNVTITGLIRNTQIRITDVSGNLVYRTVSDGGQATWDLKTYNGKKVTTGVYLVFCSSEDGSQSHVTKMLVIR
ncbi:MAG TPA: T9SS type A sorting domain-containing protein [Bacteroidales bacterium]|nr:T9SS type A sorting domain-containing protein [Bacteroidales bacterium]HPT21032.1 T9SS type A sorting domain-containing protein [Bacteroidales bacterium]